MVNAKALQRLGSEVLQQFLAGGLFGERPLFEFENTILCAEITLEVGLSFTAVEHLFRLEIAE